MKLLRRKVKVKLFVQDHWEVTKTVIKTQRHMMLQSLPLRNEVGGFASQQHVLNRQSPGESEDLG